MSELEPAPPLHRMWLKTTGDRDEIERICLNEVILGLGWGYRWRKQPPPTEITWEKYVRWAESTWRKRDIANVRRFRQAEGFTWTRTADGIYYLAQFTGPWEYRRGDPYDALDLNNVRTARIEQIGGENEVPGAVVRRFRSRTRVLRDFGPRCRSVLRSPLGPEDRSAYEWQPSIEQVLDVLLSPFDVQDLVVAYLQAERGWILFPSRLSDSTAAYEYILRDPATGQSHAVQVKTGDTRISVATLKRANGLDGWVVSSPRAAYAGRCPRHVEQLQPGEILRFMRSRRTALPPIVSTWVQQSEP